MLLRHMHIVSVLEWGDRITQAAVHAARSRGSFGDRPATQQFPGCRGKRPPIRLDRAVRWSVRIRGLALGTRLLVLVASIAVPLTLLGAGTLWMQYRAERARAETQLIEQVRGVARLIDREF